METPTRFNSSWHPKTNPSDFIPDYFLVNLYILKKYKTLSFIFNFEKICKHQFSESHVCLLKEKEYATEIQRFICTADKLLTSFFTKLKNSLNLQYQSKSNKSYFLKT